MNTDFKNQWNFKVGMIFFGIAVVIAVIYWMDGSRRNTDTFDLLLVVCSLLGGISGVIMAIKNKWWLGILPGLLAGAGAFEIFDWYVKFFEKNHIFKIEAILVCTAGAIPGIIVYFISQKLFNKK
jgi:disulfide bond formation protein DsbB